MSLIVLQHTVLDAFDVDPTVTPNSSNRIVQGSIVGVNSSTNYLSLPSSSAFPLGIAGDSVTDEYKTSAVSAQLVVSPSGAKRWTGNRVSDMFNETLASGKMSVYIGSGKFATDQYLTHNTFTVGQPLYATSTGQLTSNAGSASTFGARVVGYVVKGPSSYPSGVPGADTDAVLGAATQNGTTMSLGQFLTFHLSI
jgi:hypothetical protein